MKNFEIKKIDLRHRNDHSWKGYIKAIWLITLALCVSVFEKRKVTHVFWYSQLQNDIPKWGRKNNHMPTFKGSPYSEMSYPHYGWSNWKDARIVGFGCDSDIVFKSRYYQ